MWKNFSGKGISIEETAYVEIVDDKIFKNLSDTVTPQGVLCLVKMENFTLSEILSGEENPLLMILEDLQDPGNLGTILRTGEGAGVTGVIMSRTSVDVFNPKLFVLPWVLCIECRLFMSIPLRMRYFLF